MQQQQQYKRAGSFEHHLGSEYAKLLADRPAAGLAGSQPVDRSELMMAQLITQGMYNLAIMGIKIREAAQAARAAAASSLGGIG